MPKVSIIVPAYNAEKYLKECLDSIVNQTLDNIEVIVVDDGSTDLTAEIIKEYAERYDFVRPLYQSNKGLFKTREIALNKAVGEYIGWVDADDFIRNDMFEIMYNAAVKNKSELVICNYKFFPEKISTKEIWFQEYKGQADVAFVERNSQPWNKIVKRELLERLEISKHFVDCRDEIYIKVLMEAKNPVTIKDELYNYRASGGMSSSYKNVEHYKAYIEASENLLKIIKRDMTEQYWIDYFSNRITYYLLMTMIVAANADDKRNYIEARLKLREMRPRYNKNQHYWDVLKKNFGMAKSQVIGRIIPSSYVLSRALCRIAFSR